MYCICDYEDAVWFKGTYEECCDMYCMIEYEDIFMNDLKVKKFG